MQDAALSRMPSILTPFRHWIPSSPAREANTPRRSIRKLRASGWQGYWIDAASALRMEKTSVIVLDPVNRDVIDQALASGTKDYVGGNCTVSLMLMAIGSLFKNGYVDWMTTMTYQAASGAGAKNMKELVSQMDQIGSACRDLLADPASAILDVDQKVIDTMTSPDFPTSQFGAPLAGSVDPLDRCAPALGAEQGGVERRC